MITVLFAALLLAACANAPQTTARVVDLYKSNKAAFCEAAVQICVYSTEPTP